MSKLDLSGNNKLGSKSPDFIRPIASALKTNTSITDLNISGNRLNAEATGIFSKDMKDMGSLSKLTWSGENYDYGRQQAPPVTLDTTMTEADLSNKHLGVSGATILAAFISTKNMQDKGSLSSLTFSGAKSKDDDGCAPWIDGDPVTINITMTEANFSGKGLGHTGGAQILAAFMSTKLFQDKGSLVSLNLAQNDIGVEGAKHVAEVLPKW